MNKKVEQILLGSLCGDGGLTKLKTINSNSTFVEGHSIKQQNYLMWKAKYLQKEFKIKLICRIRFYKFKKKQYNKFGKEICVISSADKILTKFCNLIYPSGKGNKVISMKLLNKLTWLGIAVFFVDDGSYDYSIKRVTISNNNLYLNNIIKFFKTKGFNFKKRNGIVYLNAMESKRFIKKIKPYILQMPKDIHYKIGLDKKRIINSKIKTQEYKNNYRIFYWQNHTKNSAKI